MEENKFVTFQIPLDVPQKLIDSGLVDLFAKEKGWNADGEKTSIQFLTEEIRMMVKIDFERFYSSYVHAQADKKIIEDFNLVFNKQKTESENNG